jgi:hypothetical protein
MGITPNSGYNTQTTRPRQRRIDCRGLCGLTIVGHANYFAGFSAALVSAAFVA